VVVQHRFPSAERRIWYKPRLRFTPQLIVEQWCSSA